MKAIAFSVCNKPFKPLGHPGGGVCSPMDLQWGYPQTPNYTYITRLTKKNKMENKK